jgi:NodT family efflux transporter outer membrane factor (OMF) lipoprotein
VETAAVSGYVLLRALDTRLELLSSTRDVRADALRVAQRRLDSGYGTVLEARQAEAELRATEQQIPGVQLAITRQEHALSLLLGDMPSSIARGLTLSALPIPDPGTGVPAAWLRRRPDVAQAEAQLVAADHSLDAVRAAFLPDIQLSASGGVVDSTLLPDPIQVFSLGAGILAPLLDAGRLKAQQHGAAARRDQAAIAYRKVVLQGFRDVEDALATVQRTEEQETALVRQREAVNAALEVAQKRFREGYSPYLETIDAQRNLLGVDLALAQARNDRLIAVIYLCQSLGGGWQAESP